MNSLDWIFSKKFFTIFILLLFTSLGVAIWTENYLVLALPASIIGLIALLLDSQLVFYALLFSIPISVHLRLGSLAIDLASEPLMIVLLCVFPFIFFSKPKHFKFILHPVVVLILVQLLWASVLCITSVDKVISIKYILSKLWFIIPFTVLGIFFLNKPEKIKLFFWCIFIPLLLVVFYTIVRHAALGYAFEASNTIMQPFFHNHVDYSTMIAVFLPFVWFARYWYPSYSYTRLFILASFILFILAIMGSYTRASILAIALLFPAYIVVRWRLTKWALYTAGIGIVIAVVFLLYNNKYLDYGIDYKKVVSHNENFDHLIDATYKMEDISGMERIYRWVAAQNLIKENFILGIGPNAFNPEYKKYAVASFETYVSGNPEQSTTHNYFLLIFSEQGVVGFIIFMSLMVFLLIQGTNFAHKFKDPLMNNIGYATILSFVMLIMHLLFNDMIETDKLGSLFYLGCAIIVRLDMWNSDRPFYSKEQDI